MPSGTDNNEGISQRDLPPLRSLPVMRKLRTCLPCNRVTLQGRFAKPKTIEMAQRLRARVLGTRGPRFKSWFLYQCWKVSSAKSEFYVLRFLFCVNCECLTVVRLNRDWITMNFVSGIDICRNPWERFGAKAIDQG